MTGGVRGRCSGPGECQPDKARDLLGTAPPNYDLVVCDLDGSLIKTERLSAWFAAFIRKSDLPKVTFHDLRRTYGTLLAHAGVHSKTAAAALGHSDPLLTQTVYMRVLPEMSVPFRA